MQKENLKNIDWHGEATKLSLENRLFINGEFCDSADGGRLSVVNPASGEKNCATSPPAVKKTLITPLPPHWRHTNRASGAILSHAHAPRYYTVLPP